MGIKFGDFNQNVSFLNVADFKVGNSVYTCVVYNILVGRGVIGGF